MYWVHSFKKINVSLTLGNLMDFTTLFIVRWSSNSPHYFPNTFLSCMIRQNKFYFCKMHTFKMTSLRDICGQVFLFLVIRSTPVFKHIFQDIFFNLLHLPVLLSLNISTDVINSKLIQIFKITIRCHLHYDIFFYHYACFTKITYIYWVQISHKYDVQRLKP